MIININILENKQDFIYIIHKKNLIIAKNWN